MPPGQHLKIHPILWIGLILSVLNALGSIFIFDGSDAIHLRYGIFWSAILLPLGIILGILMRKKYKYWYAIPLLILISLISFSISLNTYIAKSDFEFCKELRVKGDKITFDSAYCDELMSF